MLSEDLQAQKGGGEVCNIKQRRAGRAANLLISLCWRKHTETGAGMLPSTGMQAETDSTKCSVTLLLPEQQPWAEAVVLQAVSFTSEASGSSSFQEL